MQRKRIKIVTMKKSKFTESQIAFAIKQAETGTKVEEVCRQMGISSATFFNWKKKYGGLGISEVGFFMLQILVLISICYKRS
jgi:transposase-like protein